MNALTPKLYDINCINVSFVLLAIVIGLQISKFIKVALISEDCLDELNV